MLNLSYKKENKDIWIALLSFCLGCLLPSPVIIMVPWEDYLRHIYYDPSHPASYEGEKAVYNAVKREKKYKISHKQIREWLQNQDAYSLNKSVKRNFQ